MQSTKNATIRRLSPLVKIQSRTVIIPRTKNMINRSRQKKIKHVTLNDIDPNKVLNIEDPKLLAFKVKQLQEFTRSIRENVKLTETNLVNEEEITNLSMEKVKMDADTLYNNLLVTPNKKSLIGGSDPFLIQGTGHEDGDVTLSNLIMSVSDDRVNKLIPEEIRSTIKNDKLILKSLSNKSNSNWNPIIAALAKSDTKLRNMSKETVETWLLPNAHNLSFQNICDLDNMLLEYCKDQDISMTSEMYSCLFRNISKMAPKRNEMLDPNTNSGVIKLNELLSRLDESKIKPDEYTLTSCVTYITKLKDFKTMNDFLVRFQKDFGVSPKKYTYTKIIQFYDQLGMDKQAWNIFDTMKFLSTAHQPDIFTYNQMIYMCEKEKNYAKAIDMFYEISDSKLIPNQTTFSLIAKVLASCSADNIVAEGNAESLKLLGWKFIGKLVDNEDYSSTGAMMALAAYDGDVSLSRALFFRYTLGKFNKIQGLGTNMERLWHRCISPVLLNYLLLSYSKFKPGNVPLLLGWNEGATIRRNILNSVDYAGRLGNSRNNIPFLPMIELNSVDHILAESNAMWQFSLTNGISQNLDVVPANLNKTSLEAMISSSITFDEFKLRIFEMIGRWKIEKINTNVFNHKCLGSYLTIPLRQGNEFEFWRRLDNFSFQELEFDEQLAKLYNNRKLVSQEVDFSITVELKTNDVEVIEDEYEDILKYISSIQQKLLYDNSTYEIAMKGATKFHNRKRANKIWTDRGLFRKSSSYSALDIKDRVKNDSEFAKLMVDYFCNEKQFGEAMSIVLSSKRYIKWTYTMVKYLLHGLEKIEDRKNIEILLDVINKKSSPIDHINQRIKELSLK